MLATVFENFFTMPFPARVFTVKVLNGHESLSEKKVPKSNNYLNTLLLIVSYCVPNYLLSKNKIIQTYHENQTTCSLRIEKPWYPEFLFTTKWNVVFHNHNMDRTAGYNANNRMQQDNSTKNRNSLLQRHPCNANVFVSVFGRNQNRNTEKCQNKNFGTNPACDFFPHQTATMWLFINCVRGSFSPLFTCYGKDMTTNAILQ